MRSVKSASLVAWPNTDPMENFRFSVNDADGVFEFKFKWLNGRWNCWATMPDGTVREAGVYPGVVNWGGFLDYGLLFDTSLPAINFDALFTTELYILKWQ